MIFKNNSRGSLGGKIVFYGLGITATTSILTIPVAGQFITAFTIMLAVAFIYLLFGKGRRLSFNELDKRYLLWMMIGLLSSFWGAVFFIGEDDFQQTAISFIPKIIIYILLFIILKRNVKCFLYSKWICDGLLFGIVFNICWAIFDAIGYYATGTSITNELFAYYISSTDIRYGQASLIIGSTIRACGINYDPANIGLFAPVAALYGLKKRLYIIYGLSVVSILASLSHTAFLGIFLVTIYYLYKSKRRVVSLIVFGIAITGIITLYSFLKLDTLGQMTEAFIERTEQKADGSELQGNRGEYWGNFIPAAISQPSSLIIGTGYSTASYAYLKHGYSHHDVTPYDPEQTYFSNYFDLGLIGLIIFLTLLYGIYKKSEKMHFMGNKQHVFIISGIVGSSIAFLCYHYTLYSVVMLLIIAGIILCDKNLYRYNIS